MGSLLCYVPQVAAQLPGMRKYTQLDGFSATNSYEFAQDERGLLWIGTDNGGMTFDGKKFKTLLDKRSFGDVEILRIQPLGNDRCLFLPLSQRVYLMDKGTLVTAAQEPILRDIINPTHNVVQQDPVTRTVWLTNSHRLTTLYCFEAGKIKSYHINNKYFFIHTILNDHFIGNLIDSVTDVSTPCVYNWHTQTYYRLYKETGKKLFSKEHTVTAEATRDNNYLLTTVPSWKQINIYKYKNNDSIVRQSGSLELSTKFVIGELPTKPSTPPLVSIDHNLDIWIKYIAGGISYYGNLEKPYTGQEVFHFTEPNMINTLFVDRNSNLWLSSQNNALYFISKKHFRNALLTRNFPLKKEIPKSISGDGQGRLCIGYNNDTRLACIQGQKHRIIKLGDRFRQGIRGLKPIGHNRFLAFDDVLALYDAKANTMTLIKDAPCKDVCLYGTQDLLIANNGEVFHIASYLNKPVTQRVFNARATAVDVLPGGTILIGTARGLFTKQSLKSDAMTVKDSALQECNITEIMPVPGGHALIGTNAKGMFLYYSDGRVKPITESKLTNIRSLYQQNDSTYWAATNEGAYAYTFNRDWVVKEIRNYTFYDGLPSNNATSVYVYKDTAYVATSEGIGILPLQDSTLLQMAPPDLYLNTLQTDKAVFRDPDSVLTLPPDQNNLLLSLSAISYESLGNIEYHYRLYPLQTKWVTATDPDIRFAELPPGDYTFQAYALNAKGTRSLRTIALDIHIKPYFWQTLYFKIPLFTLVILLMYLSLRWWLLRRDKRKYVKVQEKKRLAELELEAIKAQINPHFIYNCLNSIQYLNYKTEHAQAQQYLDLFARLIRMTMQYSQQTFITLQEEVDYLSLYLQLEQLRFKDKLRYDIRIEEGTATGTLLPAMLIQPYVENALKHGIAGNKKGQVLIQFRQQENNLQVIVQDNGPGFFHTGRPGALGLRLSGTRALSYNELFNLNIRIHCYNRQDNEPGLTGATVKIDMDLKAAIQNLP